MFHHLIRLINRHYSIAGLMLALRTAPRRGQAHQTVGCSSVIAPYVARLVPSVYLYLVITGSQLLKYRFFSEIRISICYVFLLSNPWSSWWSGGCSATPFIFWELVPRVPGCRVSSATTSAFFAYLIVWFDVAQTFILRALAKCGRSPQIDKFSAMKLYNSESPRALLKIAIRSHRINHACPVGWKLGHIRHAQIPFGLPTRSKNIWTISIHLSGKHIASNLP